MDVMIDWNKFQQNGFIYLDLCSSPEIEALKEVYNENLAKSRQTGISVSLNSGNPALAKKVSEKIYQILKPSISSLFSEYDYFVGHFIVKSKHTYHNFDLHRDWNIIDETIYNSIGIWIPLSVSTPDNGGMCFAPQSHLFNNVPRSGSLGIPFIKIEPDLEPYLVRTHLVPGQAVCFYKNLFHGSFSNPTEDDRVAVLVSLMPKNATTEYLHWNEDTQRLQVYSMTAEELLVSLPDLEKGLTPVTTLKREIEVAVPPKKQTYIPKEDLLEWLKKENRFIGNKDNPSVLDELREKGFAIIRSAFNWRVLKSNPFVAERLKMASSDTSFHYSLLNNTSETNKILSSLIIQQFKASLSQLFSSHRFLAGSFLVKQAQDNSELYLHQDWNNTDEALFSSLTAWTPLVDTDETSGGMFFLKGSHKYFDNLRSNSYETARLPLTEIGAENITPVNIQRGDILLFNPAVWHGSFSNRLSCPREVFTCIILPQSAPFYYFHKQSEETALRYNVPDDMLENYLKDIVGGKKINTLFSSGDCIKYIHKKPDASDLIEKQYAEK